ncbi:hypothetical protein [uncultured Gelidibacter sp.]|uniref:hypothetical protein n=1 Tax=uncultured Gelidibacter sp. TaxID=259318 RepID=UPI0026082399|nr:hypothetical protein [uncultured Gelidibacter sp.]
MVIRKILTGVLIMISVLFLAFQIFQFEVEAAGMRVLLIIFLTTLYCYEVKNRRFYFLAFLTTFGIAEIINFISCVAPGFLRTGIDYIYYSANSLYILSYVFLTIQILRSMNLMHIIKKFPFHILIMAVLDVFFVFIVTDTTLDRLSYTQYFMEFVYNSVIMILMTVALINYIDKDDKKSINLLIGSVFIVFAEVIQLAYFYITNINVLNVIYSLFILLGFLFFFLQSRLNYQTPEDKRLYQDLLY